MSPHAESNRRKADPGPHDADLPAQTRMRISRTSPNKMKAARFPACPVSFVPLQLDGDKLVASSGSKSLIECEVGMSDLQRMTDLFYQKAFLDATLDPFIHSHSEPHGLRFAKWIHQQLTGSCLWDEDCRLRDKTPFPISSNDKHIVFDLTSAHIAARGSVKRPKEHRERAFQLDECRVWMRLHFWAMRESGVFIQSPSFADYYVRFIGHYIGIYESQSPMFTRESLRWSADPKNIDKYIANGRQMTDVLGLSIEEARQQIPEKERSDTQWPYYQLREVVI
jgi:hypothetical protein